MSLSIVSALDWPRVLRLANDTCELLLTLDVGPRVMAYNRLRHPGPLKVYPDQLGTTGETVWRARGGHRLWAAPESQQLTYVPDNVAIEHEGLGETGVRLTAPVEPTTGLVKQIELVLGQRGTRVEVVHRIRNAGEQTHRLAAWALTVMEVGGTAIMPQPPLGEHPRDLLPNRALVLWPYTDLADPRWNFGARRIMLRQDAQRGPTKIGLAYAPGWLAYAWHDQLFVKQFSGNASATYPDLGCQAEVFTNHRMLELESLGPLVTLGAGHVVEHRETWSLHPFAGTDEHRLDDHHLEEQITEAFNAEV